MAYLAKFYLGVVFILTCLSIGHANPIGSHMQSVIISSSNVEEPSAASTGNHTALPTSQNTALVSSTTLIFVTTTPATQAATQTTAPDTSTYLVATITGGQEVCLDGWEPCRDGTCEPFHWLCEEHGGAAVQYTTSAHLPMTETVTQPQQTSAPSIFAPSTFDPSTFAPSTFASVPVMTETFPANVPGPQESCPSGFVQCKEGNCEPFEALCGEAGIVTVTYASTSSSVVVTKSTSAPQQVLTTMISQSVQTGSTLEPVVNTVSPPAVSTDPQGSCPNGFVQCKDGTCESFEALCGEQGVVTVTFPTGQTDMGTQSSLANTAGTTPLITTSSSTLPVITTTIPTTPMQVVTDSSGKEVCLDGWELCKDGTCEAFHWLCEEHGDDGGIIIG